jgi:Apea-like HEPN
LNKKTLSQVLADGLNHISSLLELGLPSGYWFGRQSVFGASHEHPLRLRAGGRDDFQNSVDELIGVLPNMTGTISRAFVTDDLISRIREKKLAAEPFSVEDADNFQRALCGLPLQKYRVLRPIYGVEMTHESAPIDFGDFRIDFGRRVLVSEGKSELLALVLKPEDEDKLFIQCNVVARDTETASELADGFFYRFELIFRFFIGARIEHIEVGILNHKGAQMRDRFVFSEEGHLAGHASAWRGAFQPFILGDSRFPIPAPPLSRLFELITRSNSDFEKHIIRCAEWTGQAIAEPNEAAALVKAAIALEVLFSANEKGVITPSIMAQISESCAYLLGGGSASSIDVEREVKRLYGVRSSVVHSGKDSVDSKDLNSFIGICRQVVILLLSSEELSGIDSMAKLADYFRGRKYASPKG